MSRLMKAFVGGAFLLAALMLLGLASTFVRPKLGLHGRPSASALVAQDTALEQAKQTQSRGERQTRAAPEAKKPKEPEAVKRPIEPAVSADPIELTVRPDERGMLTFRFNGQTWPAVFEWLADISEMSLQWEELPAGRFTYAARKPCTVDEVRDKINCVLLSRGFTLLRNGEILIVANLKNLDASLAPRVTIEELAKRGKHELVKIFVRLDWLLAETAAEEIKPLLSPYGKVATLKATNRLELLDTVDNLEQIIKLIDEEQSGSGRQKLVEEFHLRYMRAAEVLRILQMLLDLEPKREQPADSQALMAAQLLLEQTQPEGQPGNLTAAAKKEEESQVNLAINSRTNSILVNAPPDKMAMVRQAISAVDVPPYAGQNPLTGIQKIKVYRVAGISPAVLVKILNELGSLDPTTRLEVDQKNRTIIAWAPPADQLLIRSLVEKIDGTGRRFEVIQLRQLSAEYVAGSVHVLMNESERTDAGRNRYRFPYYSYYLEDGARSPPQDAGNRFQVEADIEHNRLLLRANDVELAAVKMLLSELGEIAPEERNGLTTRMLPPLPGEETERLLERLQKIWPTVAPNPLDVRLDSADSAGPSLNRKKKRPSSKTRSEGKQDDARPNRLPNSS